MSLQEQKEKRKWWRKNVKRDGKALRGEDKVLKIDGDALKGV